MFRRTLLLAMPAAALAACTKTTSNGVTTFTLDTKRVDTDGQAILTALNAMISAPSVALLLGPHLVEAEAAIAAAQVTLAAFDQMTGGSMSATYDPTHAQATIVSFISDAQQVLTLVVQTIPKISASNVATSIGNYVAAVQALIAFIQVAVDLETVKLKPQMTETQAIHIANH